MIYHPAFRLLKKFIRKIFGNIIYISSNRLKWGKVRDYENVTWSFAPHDISMISFLLTQTSSSKSTILKVNRDGGYFSHIS